MGSNLTATSISLKRLLRFPLFFFAAMGMMLFFTGCAGSDTDITAGWSQQKLMDEAKGALKDQDFANCTKYFEKLESRYPFGPTAEQSQLNIAYCHWKKNDIELALIAINRFIQLHPGHSEIDYAYYLKGLITFNDTLGFFANFSGQDLSERDPKASRDAYEAFKVLTIRYPDSKYTTDALDRMRYIVNSLAESDVNAARFYFRRGAYIASINRAQNAIKEYDRAPAIEEALYLMVKSYDAMNMKELSDDTMRVFNTNFPQSDIFISGKRISVTAKNKSWWQIWNNFSD